MKEIIHFAHGNGFPALCYKQMLDFLTPKFTYCYIDKIGHNPKFPVSENWLHLIDELIASVKKQSSQPVIAVGHSLGGVLSILAAIQEPALFKKVILLDSPLISPLKSIIVKLAKSLAIIDRITPAHKTKNRKKYWQSRAELVNYLKTRELFKTFTEKCLEDYINYGLEYKEDDGYYLRFDRHIEYQIYRTIPHNIATYHSKLAMPAALIYGDKSSIVGNLDIRYMKKNFAIKCFKTKGTHLFPMEHPKAVANKIMKVIDILGIND